MPKKADDKPQLKGSKDNRAFLEQMRKRYHRCIDNPDEKRNRNDAVNDLEFVYVPTMQWDEITKRARGKDRPMYEFNNVRVTVKNVVNDIRANRPAGKVRAVEDNDKDTAEIVEGLCRNIWNVSDGDTIMDGAAEYQVACGMGAWRVATDYSHDTAFDQDIFVESIRNPLCLWADTACKDPMKRDAKFWFLTDNIAKEDFETKYGDRAVIQFESNEFDNDWIDEDKIRICEYWWKEPVTRTIALLSDGASVYKDEIKPGQLEEKGLTILKERDAKCFKIKSAICAGDSILEGPTEWAGSIFPFVVVYGEYIVINGRTYWFGLARHAKDAQRAHNSALTGVFETIALAPQAKYWATPKQAEGNIKDWAEAHEKNLPAQLFNPDPAFPGAPQRMGGADVPVALIQAAQMSGDALKGATGIFDPSIGKESNVTSGIALRSQAAQGKVATFNYGDNVAKAMQFTWEICGDLIPYIYDTARTLRILGADGAEKYVKVNQPDEQGRVLNDLSRGKFDYTVSSGPSFATQRQEAVESYGMIAQSNPQVWGVAGDLIFKAMDLPYAEQIAKRMEALLPPQIQATLNQDKPLPPEVQRAMMQVDQAMQQVQQHGQLVKAAEAELEQMKGEDAKRKADLQGIVSDIEVKRAQFDADIVKSLADIAVKEAAFTVKQAQASSEQDKQSLEGERSQLQEEVQNAIAMITAHAQGLGQEMQHFVGLASDAIGEVHSSVQKAAVPRKKTISAKRVNGRLVAQITDEDGSTRQAEIARNNGELTGTIQ